MASNLNEDLRQRLEQACSDISKEIWGNITVVNLPWNHFPKINNSSNKSSRDLIDESKEIFSLFYERWKRVCLPLQGATHLEEDEEYPLEYLEKLPRICILLNTLDVIDLIDNVPGDDEDLPFGKDKLDFLPDEKVSEFLECQKFFLRDIPQDEAVWLEHELPPFREGRFLGEGSSASITKVFNVFTGKHLTRKLYSLGSGPSMEHLLKLEKVVAEIRNLQRLAGNRHIVQLHGSYLRGTKVAILLQPVADYNLRDYLLHFHRSMAHLKMKRVLYRLFGCLCITLQKIHEESVRDTDIKPVNILIHGSDVLFTDFGNATAFADEERMTKNTTVGETVHMYTAPEVWKKEARDVISDVFSLGCVFLEVITVLARRPIRDLKRAFDHGYGQDLPRLKKWLEDLEKSSSNTLLSLPIRWCSRMLEEKVSRPDTGQLIREIIQDSREGASLDNYFCEDCCRALALFALRAPIPATQRAEVKPEDSSGTSVALSALSHSEAVANAKASNDALNTMLCMLNKKEGNTSAQEMDGNTALHLAARAGSVMAVQKLLEEGADPKARNKDGDTALHLAARAGSVMVVQKLLEKGADPNAWNKDGDTELHLAARAGSVVAVQKLLEEGADPKAQNNDGDTALHLAAGVGSVMAVAKLLEKGANPKTQNKDGVTALDVVLRMNRPQA